MDQCERCHAPLTADDIGAYRKFRNRNAVTFLCIPCFCRELQCEESYMRDRIEFLRRNGCALFPPPKNPDSR